MILNTSFIVEICVFHLEFFITIFMHAESAVDTSNDQ